MVDPPMKLGAIILAGGQSRRMGLAKASLEIGGEYLLQRVVRIVATVCEPVVVAAKAGQSLPPLVGHVEVVHDHHDHQGPLAGILAGMEALPVDGQAAFVSAGDYPLLRPAFIARLANLLGEHRAVVPQHRDRLHPLAACYRLETREVAREMLSEGNLRAIEFADRCKPRIVTEADFHDVDPELESLLNVNERTDLEEAIRRMERVDRPE